MTIAVRDVPDDLHRRLGARAAMEGATLSDLALADHEPVLRSCRPPS